MSTTIARTMRMTANQGSAGLLYTKRQYHSAELMSYRPRLLVCDMYTTDLQTHPPSHLLLVLPALLLVLPGQLLLLPGLLLNPQRLQNLRRCLRLCLRRESNHEQFQA